MSRYISHEILIFHQPAWCLVDHWFSWLHGVSALSEQKKLQSWPNGGKRNAVPLISNSAFSALAFIWTFLLGVLLSYTLESKERWIERRDMRLLSPALNVDVICRLSVTTNDNRQTPLVTIFNDLWLGSEISSTISEMEDAPSICQPLSHSVLTPIIHVALPLKV